MVDEFGYVNVDKLCEENQRLSLVQQIVERCHYLHWELEFAVLFNRRGGFDLIVGNPPWIKLEWKEGNILGDTEPKFIFKKIDGAELTNLRDEIIQKHEIKNNYLESYEEISGILNFISALQNYPQLSGIQPNLYKCFLPIAWNFSSKTGAISYIHDQGIFDDPKGGNFRKLCYERMKYWFRFENEKKLFADVGNEKKFEISIYGPENCEINFLSIY